MFMVILNGDCAPVVLLQRADGGGKQAVTAAIQHAPARCRRKLQADTRCPFVTLALRRVKLARRLRQAVVVAEQLPEGMMRHLAAVRVSLLLHPLAEILL